VFSLDSQPSSAVAAALSTGFGNGAAPQPLLPLLSARPAKAPFFKPFSQSGLALPGYVQHPGDHHEIKKQLRPSACPPRITQPNQPPVLDTMAVFLFSWPHRPVIGRPGTCLLRAQQNFARRRPCLLEICAPPL
jgi:hypothetical protein